jgi:hypothetical protein
MATNVYKTINQTEAVNRTINPVSAEKKTKIVTIVNNFITYLKAAHS